MISLKEHLTLFMSAIGLLLLSPFFPHHKYHDQIRLTWTCIYLNSVGWEDMKSHFKILKFRTMVTDAEKRGAQITVGRDSRITRVRPFSKESQSLMSFPQLINVFKGDMSLVGPRPEVPKYTSYYNEEQKSILQIRPGITDYASIKYRNESEILGASPNPEKTYIEEVMQDKLKINLEYLNKRTIWEDISIILKTVAKIIH